MLSITSNPKASLPVPLSSMVSIPAPTSLSNSSQTILTSSKNISFRNKKKLQFKHSSLSISCGVTQINQIDEFSAWKSLRPPHPTFSTQHARLTQRVLVGQQVSENAAETKSYSVWAIPQENVRENLEKLMKNLQSEFGGPEFSEPHFTVVGPNEQTETDAINKFRAACKGVKPYTVTIDTIVPGPSYFECVYGMLQDTKEVSDTADHCSKFFGDDIPNQYKLHVSLIFGDFTDEEKKRIIEKAEALCPDLTRLNFQTSKFFLYQTDTNDLTTTTWKKVDEYNLI